MTLSSLHESLKLPPMWHDHTSTELDSIRLCKIIVTSSQPLLITRSIVIDCKRKWKVFIHNHEVKKCSALKDIPLELCRTSFMELLQLVDGLNICAGQPDSNFIVFADSRKGKFISKDGSVNAFIDQYAPVCTNGEVFSKTIHTSSCELIVCGQKCNACICYRRTLRTL